MSGYFQKGSEGCFGALNPTQYLEQVLQVRRLGPGWLRELPEEGRGRASGSAHLICPQDSSSGVS